MPHLETDELVAAQAAGDEQSQEGTIAQAEAGFGIGRPEQFARFPFGQPFSEPLAALFDIRNGTVKLIGFGGPWDVYGRFIAVDAGR